MPNESRDVILARIRSSIQKPQHGYDLQQTEIDRSYQRSGTLSQEACLQLFCERLREYDATVTLTDSTGVATSIARIVGAKASQAEPGWVVAEGFPASWLPPSDAFLWEQQSTVDNLNQCSGVITTCSAGIAVTGTIALQHGPGEGRRRTSLLPDRHLCVIEATQVVETVPEAFERLAAAATRPLTFISGPSATADIEMTRIRGVHGPRQLEVIIVGV